MGSTEGEQAGTAAGCASLDAGESDWRSQAVHTYNQLPQFFKDRVSLADPPAGDDQQHAFYWQQMNAVLAAIAENQVLGLDTSGTAVAASSSSPAAAEAPVVLDITGVTQYQLLAERIATASAEAWAAPISYGEPSEDDMFGVRSGTHPLAAATQLLRMVTNDVTFQVENTNSKSRGAQGFYLYHGEGSNRFRKDRKLRSKANCWDAFCAMADTRVDKYDATSAYRLPQATRDALKGLQAGIRSVLSEEMQVQLDS